MLEGTLGVLYFNAVIPKSSCMIVVSSCSVWGVKLNFGVRRNQGLPMPAVAVYAAVITVLPGSAFNDGIRLWVHPYSIVFYDEDGISLL